METQHNSRHVKLKHILIFVLHLAQFSDSKNATLITWNNHKEFVNQAGFTWVLFGASWCGHTQAALPQYFDFSSKTDVYAGHEINFGWTFVDIASSQSPHDPKINLRHVYNVTAYPNMRLFYNGKYMNRYRGRKTFDQFTEYLKLVIPKVAEHMLKTHYHVVTPKYSVDTFLPNFNTEPETTTFFRTTTVPATTTTSTAKPTTTTLKPTTTVISPAFESTTVRFSTKDNKKFVSVIATKKYTSRIPVVNKIDLSGLKNNYVLQICTVVIVVIGMILFMWLAFFHKKPKPDVLYTNDASMAHIGLQEDDEKLI